MDLEQCWMRYLKAEQFTTQGHWPEAHRLYDDVLSHLPNHIHAVLEDEQTKPCLFICMISGLRDASVAQSEILNKLGLHQEAYSTLNQSYALLQFLQLENHPLIHRVRSLLSKQSEDLLAHMAAFCSAQRDAKWMIELNHVSRAHEQFLQLQALSEAQANPSKLYN
ncbi:hypothetical protein SO574_19195 [Vibrio alfacsensis]|uniref:hypothetical protein n=1 Tax=Vibrio alfacsensis TaxID=1074311 RepID=UPI002ADE748B|nr:hypothetical protein [Vibrio alfacsensis]WQE77899.1 hypothetical protein SO574_19195 [Vibrio alfacsensis]